MSAEPRGGLSGFTSADTPGSGLDDPREIDHVHLSPLSGMRRVDAHQLAVAAGSRVRVTPPLARVLGWGVHMTERNLRSGEGIKQLRVLQPLLVGISVVEDPAVVGDRQVRVVAVDRHHLRSE